MLWRCPSCADRPLLTVVRTYESVLPAPLRSCPTCLGIWGQSNALSAGISSELAGHRALKVERPPRRCPQCTGALDRAESCSRCSWTRPILSCPCCANPMNRQVANGVVVDDCTSCRSVWFDGGELRAVYSVAPRPTLTAAAVEAQGAVADHHRTTLGLARADRESPGLEDLLPFVFQIARLLLRL